MGLAGAIGAQFCGDIAGAAGGRPISPLAIGTRLDLGGSNGRGLQVGVEMAIRDRIAEIAEIKRRGPRDAEGFSREFDVLQRQWARPRTGDSVTDYFFVIRAVTLLEGFTRGWIAALIDHGGPFVERAGELKFDFKFDFGSVRKIGSLITLGDVVAHGISINNVGQITGIFKVLLAEELLPLLKNAVYVHRSLADRLLSEGSEETKAGTLIVKDVEKMCNRLARLFELRQIGRGQGRNP